MKINWNERKPEIILLSVVTAAILLAVVFVVVYVNLPAHADPVHDTFENDITTATVPEETHEPEDSIIITSGKPAPDAAPDIIVRFFAYLDAGEYDKIGGLMYDGVIPLSSGLNDIEPASNKDGIFNYKKARLLEVNFLGTNIDQNITTWECFVDVETYRAGDVAANGINRYEVDIVYYGGIERIDRWWRDDTYGEYEYIEHTTTLPLDEDEIEIRWIEHGAEISEITASDPSGKHDISVMTFDKNDAVLFIDNEYFITCDYRTGEITDTIGPGGLSDSVWNTEFSDSFYDFSLSIMSCTAPAPEKEDGISRLYSLFAYTQSDVLDKKVSVAELSDDAEYYIRNIGDLSIFWAEQNGQIVYVDTIENVFSDYFEVFCDYTGKVIRSAQTTDEKGTVRIDRDYTLPSQYYFYFADLYTGRVHDPLAGIDSDPDLWLRGSYIFNSDKSAAVLGGGVNTSENSDYRTTFYVDLLTGKYFNVADIDGVWQQGESKFDYEYIYTAGFTDKNDVLIISVYKYSTDLQTNLRVVSYEYDLTKKTLTPADVFAGSGILYQKPRSKTCFT